MPRGISIKGLGGNYTASKLRKKIKSLEHNLKIANQYLKVLEGQKALKK